MEAAILGQEVLLTASCIQSSSLLDMKVLYRCPLEIAIHLPAKYLYEKWKIMCKSTQWAMPQRNWTSGAGNRCGRARAWALGLGFSEPFPWSSCRDHRLLHGVVWSEQTCVHSSVPKVGGALEAFWKGIEVVVSTTATIIVTISIYGALNVCHRFLLNTA